MAERLLDIDYVDLDYIDATKTPNWNICVKNHF